MSGLWWALAVTPLAGLLGFVLGSRWACSKVRLVTEALDLELDALEGAVATTNAEQDRLLEAAVAAWTAASPTPAWTAASERRLLDEVLNAKPLHCESCQVNIATKLVSWSGDLEAMDPFAVCKLCVGIIARDSWVKVEDL